MARHTIPMPNERLHGMTVVASCYLTDTTYLVLLLCAVPPFFVVAHGGSSWLAVLSREANIVHAVRSYEAAGGDV